MSDRTSIDGDVLLTGATGFLGMELLARFLTRTDRTVLAIVRARDSDHARARIDDVGVRVTFIDGLATVLPGTDLPPGEATFDECIDMAHTLGVGAIIGTGIFVLTGQAAAANAGPAIVISMLIAGLTSVLAALCYSEFAATVPVAGSAYTYAYATLGEFIAWIIGWDLILEYALGSATVAVGWSGNFVTLLGQLGVPFPAAISGAPGTAMSTIATSWPGTPTESQRKFPISGTVTSSRTSKPSLSV